MIFKEFWLERPPQQARAMKVYALLDTQSLTGAYEFVVRPGEGTVVDVRARLFERKRVKELGIAPLTSMFLFASRGAITKQIQRLFFDPRGAGVKVMKTFIHGTSCSCKSRVGAIGFQ